jgi:hypothetical protein
MTQLNEYSHLSREKLLATLKFGKGPKISIYDLRARGDLSSNVLGHCVCPGYPFPTIEIQDSFVRGLESANLESTKQATAFLLAVTLLHETIHYGNAFLGIQEPGETWAYSFEEEAFGAKITKRNASEYVYDFFKN